VNDSVRNYGEFTPIKARHLGGVGMQPQIDAVRRGLDI